jgi:hypothetical protein
VAHGSAQNRRSLQVMEIPMLHRHQGIKIFALAQAPFMHSSLHALIARVGHMSSKYPQQIHIAAFEFK